MPPLPAAKAVVAAPPRVKLIRRARAMHFEADGAAAAEAATSDDGTIAGPVPRPPTRKMVAVALAVRPPGPAPSHAAVSVPALSRVRPSATAAAGDEGTIPHSITSVDSKVTLRPGLWALRWGVLRWPAVAVTPSQLYQVSAVSVAHSRQHDLNVVRCLHAHYRCAARHERRDRQDGGRGGEGGTRWGAKLPSLVPRCDSTPRCRQVGQSRRAASPQSHQVRPTCNRVREDRTQSPAAASAPVLESQGVGASGRC